MKVNKERERESKRGGGIKKKSTTETEEKKNKMEVLALNSHLGLDSYFIQ